MKHVKSYLKVFLFSLIVLFWSKADAQVSGFVIADGSFPATHNLGVAFPINVKFNWTTTTTTAKAVIAYNNLFVNYDVTCQNVLPGCMSIVDNGSAITISISNLSNCINTTSISFNVCFKFKCPDSCMGENKPSLFIGTLTDNLGTTQSSSTTANGMLENNVWLNNTFLSFNAITSEATFQACFSNPACFNIRNPVFNIALSPAMLGATISSVSSRKYTFGISGLSFTPNTALFEKDASDCFYYVVKLPCNTGQGQMLTSNITLTGVNCGIAGSSIKGPVSVQITIPATFSSNANIDVSTTADATTFNHFITNTGNTPLNLTTTSLLPLVHVESVSQSSAQPGLIGTVKYFNCALVPTAAYNLDGTANNGLAFDNHIPALGHTRKIEHIVTNLLPGNSVTFTTTYSTGSSCFEAGISPYRDTLNIVYSCTAPPVHCIDCGAGGTRNVVMEYTTPPPAPVIHNESSNTIIDCKKIGDTIAVCYAFSNTAGVALNNGVLNVALPAGVRAIPQSFGYFGFASGAPAIIAGSNIQFNLPVIPVNAGNVYRMCFKVVIGAGAVGGPNYFTTFISGSNLMSTALCNTVLTVCSYAASGIDKKVKVSIGGNYATNGQVAPGSEVEYQIVLHNTGTVALNNLEVIDRMPNPGNLTILGSPGSAPIPNQFTMQMIGAAANPDYTVYYTTTKNICTQWPGTGTPCNTGVWNTAVVDGGIKFSFLPAFSLAAGDSFTIAFKTRVPANATNGFTDCNTAGFFATALSSAANGDPLNAAESAPACITVANPCPQSITPAFTVTKTCVNGTTTVSVVALDQTGATHEWSLMQTSISGNTTDGATIGQIGATQFGTSTTFTIPSSGNYYIKHHIYVTGCADATLKIPVTLLKMTGSVNIQSAAGSKKTSFCLGEDVWFNGSGSTGETAYTITFFRRTPGIGAALESFATYSHHGTAGLLNLSQLLSGFSPALYFEPQYEYGIKLTLTNPESCPAETTVSGGTFKVICCDNIIKPNFQLAITPALGTYTITPVLLNLYPTVQTTHEWYVLSSHNQTGGPYTPELSAATAAFTFTDAQYDLYYTIIHKIKTACGEVCSTVVQYQSKANKSVETTTSDCCLAFRYWPNGAGTDPQELSAAFEMGTTPLGGGQYTIDLSPSFDYNSNPAITSEWFVLSSTSPSDGPYVQIAYSDEYDFSYSPADYGLYYFVIHKVKSPCGDVCYGQSVCYNCSTKKSDMYGVIDCGLLDEIWPACHAPAHLVNDCERGRLSWDAVPGAAQYEIELNYNDPNCCRSRYEPTSIRIPSDINRLDLNSVRLPDFDCIRWRVRAKCEGGVIQWSDYSCYFCGPVAVPIDPGSEKNGKRSANSISAAAETNNQPQVFPNPNKGDMYLQMKAEGELVLSVDVFNAQGVLVKTIGKNKYPDGKFGTRLKMGAGTAKGLYLVVFKTNFGTYSRKVIIN